METASFRLVQEAVTNAVRHADPRSIHVSIRRVPEALELRVRDDGKGFDPQSPVCSIGTGLVGMEERVALLDGELKVTSTPGGGTEILARFPFSGAFSE